MTATTETFRRTCAQCGRMFDSHLWDNELCSDGCWFADKESDGDVEDVFDLLEDYIYERLG